MIRRKMKKLFISLICGMAVLSVAGVCSGPVMALPSPHVKIMLKKPLVLSVKMRLFVVGIMANRWKQFWRT